MSISPKYQPLVSILFFILFSPLVFAQGINVEAERENFIAETGKLLAVKFTVTNNQDKEDQISMSVFPTFWRDIIASFDKDRVTLAPESSSTVILYLNVPECAEELTTTFTVRAKSLSTSAESSDSIILSTQRVFPVCISGLELNTRVLSPSQTLRIEVKVKNPNNDPSPPFYVVTSIWKLSTEIKSFEERIDAIPGKSEEKIVHEYLIEKHAAPDGYLVESGLYDRQRSFIHKVSETFIVRTLPANVTQTKDIKWGLLSQTVIITLTNDGNVPVSQFNVTESVPSSLKAFFFLKTPSPFPSEDKEGRTYYTWAIGPLDTGESTMIMYELNLANAWIIILILIGLAALSFRYVFGVRVVKKHRHYGVLTKDKEVTVALEIRNRTRHGLSDVVVRDFVPSIAVVLERFGTLRPTIRKVPGGTELVWRLEHIRPMEERIITYSIKPVLEVRGSVRLPNAHVRYLDKKKEIRRSVSKSILIRAR